MISTSKRHAEHPFAGQNTQQLACIKVNKGSYIRCLVWKWMQQFCWVLNPIASLNSQQSTSCTLPEGQNQPNVVVVVVVVVFIIGSGCDGVGGGFVIVAATCCCNCLCCCTWTWCCCCHLLCHCWCWYLWWWWWCWFWKTFLGFLICLVYLIFHKLASFYIVLSKIYLLKPVMLINLQKEAN